MKRLKYAALFLLLLVFLGIPAAIALMAAADAPPRTKAPNPNGHDTLWQASRAQTPIPVDFDATEDVDALKIYLSENTEALQLLDKACGQEMMIDLESVDLESEQWFEGVGALRSLLRMMWIRARVAELEGRPADAAEIYVKMFDLSDRSDDGGLLINSLMSFAGKGMALDPMLRLADSLPADARVALAARLKEIGNDRIDVDAVMKRERAVIRKQYGFLQAGMMSLTNSVETANVTARDQEVAHKFDKLVEELSRPDVSTE